MELKTMKPEGIEPGWTPVPVTRFREVYEDPTQVAEIERIISDLRAKRGELSLPSHPAVDVLWKYAEEMHRNADSYKTGKEWAVAGDTLELSRAKLLEAFDVDRRAVAGRNYADQLRARLDSITWTDHPFCNDLRKKLEAILGKDGGSWNLAWNSSDLASAAGLLAEANSILSVAEQQNVDAAESLDLNASWRRIEDAVPDGRPLDQRVGREIEDRCQRCRSAREAHDRGDFARSLATWRVDLDPLAELLEKDRRAAEDAAAAKRQFEQSIGRRPQNRPLSNPLSEGLRQLVADSDGAEDCASRGEYLEAARIWKEAFQRMGGLVADDLAAFGDAEEARQAFEEFENAGRVRRSVWSHRTDEFQAIRQLAVDAAGKKDAGDFKEAASDWKEARRRLGVAFGEDASHHREGIIALERFRRRLKAIPARLLARSVRTDVERLVKREAILVGWLADGKFSEVEDAVGRSVESLDRLLQEDARLYQEAIQARDESHAFEVVLPEAMPSAVQASLRSSAAEVDAIETEARQAFELGEYEDAAASWKRWKEGRVEFAAEAHQTLEKFARRHRRKMILRVASISVLVLVALLVFAEGFARYRMTGLLTEVESLSEPSIEHPVLNANQVELARQVMLDGSGTKLVTPIWFRDYSELAERTRALGNSIEISRGIRQRLAVQEGEEELLAGAGIPPVLEVLVRERNEALDQVIELWLEEDFEALTPILTRIELETPILVANLREATRVRSMLEALPTLEGLPDSRGVDFSKPRQAFEDTRASAEQAWKQRDFVLAEEQVKEARRLFTLLSVEILQRRAEKMQGDFRRLWDAPSNLGRKAAANEDDVDDVDGRAAAAKEWFKFKKYEEAEAEWEVAIKLAEKTLAEGAEGANALAMARRGWEGREAQPSWTREDSGQKELARRFELAISKAEEAFSLENDGRVAKATSGYRDAIFRWNEALKESQTKVTEARQLIQSDAGDIRAMEKAIRLLRIIDPDDLGLEASSKRLAFRRSAPIDGMRLPYPIKDGVSIDLVYIEPGVYKVGDPTPLRQVVEDRDYRRIRISRGYWISANEVTQEQYEVITGERPARVLGKGLPVTDVTSVEAIAFSRGILGIMALDDNGDPDRYDFRIPTETEWEVAARSGEWHSSFKQPLDEIAWFKENSGARCHPVGLLIDNGNGNRAPKGGLHDTLGNVAEWCYDFHAEDWLDHLVDDDPGGPRAGEARVVRGGSFLDERDETTLTARKSLATDSRASDVGFRLVLTTVQSPEQITAAERRERMDPLLRGIPDADLEFKTVTIAGVPVEFVHLPIGDEGEYLWMSTTEVTNKLWSKVGKVTGREIGGPSTPAVNMSLYDTDKFFKEIRRQEGRGMDLRLPTQEEWIRACLAGGPGPYAIGDRSRSVDLDRFAWIGLGPKAGLQRVAYGKKPSYWGLYDIHGNAEEWCAAVGRNKDAGPVMGGSVRSKPLEAGADQMKKEPGSMFNEVRGFRMVAEKLP